MSRRTASREIAQGVEHQWRGKDSEGSACLLNSESLCIVELGSGVQGVSSCAERGTTQTGVKAPKCWLSDKPKGVFNLKQQGGRNRSCHPPKMGVRTVDRSTTCPSEMECVTAHLPRLGALKIDGSKPAAETPDRGATLHGGRGAFRLSRSRAVKSGGSIGNVDPGGSNSKEE